MASSRRKRVPALVADEVLFRADHTCCICRVRGKDVQIHHIDGNAANNKPANLAVVCLDCHSKVSGSRGLGKSYTPGEVRRYKRSWDLRVLDTRKIHRPRITHKKELISQIDLTVCEILACRRNNPRSIELLDMLFELHIWRASPAIDRAIVEGLHHLALMTSLQNSRLAAPVAEMLWEMCFHFFDPKEMPMDKRDQAQVEECIEALRTLGAFNSEFGHGRKATDAVAENAENFFELSLWYSKKRLANKVLRLYAHALDSCSPEGASEFVYGRSVLRRSLQKLQRLLIDERPSWSYQRRRIQKILSQSISQNRRKKGD